MSGHIKKLFIILREREVEIEKRKRRERDKNLFIIP
jgi:hypothetical protein